MQNGKTAGTFRQCAAVVLLAVVTACTDRMPAEAPAVAESPKPAAPAAETAARAVDENTARKADGLLQEGDGAESVNAAANGSRRLADYALPEVLAETGFGRAALAELGLAEAPAEVETVDAGSRVAGEPPVLAAADPVTFGAPEASARSGVEVTFSTVSTEAQPVISPLRDPNALSDEQEFAAVSNRETIESDAARRRMQVANRIVFEPADLPERQGEANVAHYALSTSHEVGSKLYDRAGAFFARFSTDERCAEFSDGYAAQQAFLDAGGPLKDELRIDPDGDGFACGWTPYIYRSMLN